MYESSMSGGRRTSEASVPLPVLREPMQEAAMRDQHDLLLRPVPQEPSQLSSPRLHGILPLTISALLAIPPILNQTQIHRLAFHQVPQSTRVLASVAGVIGRLLRIGEGDDWHPFRDLGGEGEEGGLQGAGQGRAEERFDGGKVREGAGQGAALLFAIGGQAWVEDVVICDGEVVYALQ